MAGFGKTSVTGGYYNSFFLDDTNNVWGCGSNHSSRESDECTSNFSKLKNLENICSVDSGYYHTLFLDLDGNVYSCGNEKKENQTVELGRKKSEGDETEPIRISHLPRIASIAASFYTHSLFLDEDNNVWGCGTNNSGQLGLKEKKYVALEPTRLKLSGMKAIAAGWRHSVFLDDQGTPWVCGNNSLGELGLGDRLRRNKPEKIENLPAIKEIYAGCQHTMFLAQDGSLWGTGYNAGGELGTAEKTVLKPIRIDS